MGYDELEQSEEITLIDFLYKDETLITSFYSQLFSGNLEGITKSEIAADEVNKGMDAGVKPIFKGEIKTKECNSKSLTKNISPEDYRIIELLSSLNIEVKGLSSNNSGSLTAVKGSMTFRNFEVINTLMPFVANSGLIPELKQYINPNAKNKKITMANLVDNLLKMMPCGLEFELVTKEDESAIIILKEEGLTIAANDLVRAYGREMPGEWTVVGILDKNIRKCSKSKNSFRVSIDGATDIMNEMINQGNEFVLKPLVIYRKLAI